MKMGLTRTRGRREYAGEPFSTDVARKSAINLKFFLAHREEILAMKEQIKLIKELGV